MEKKVSDNSKTTSIQIHLYFIFKFFSLSLFLCFSDLSKAVLHVSGKEKLFLTKAWKQLEK